MKQYFFLFAAIIFLFACSGSSSKNNPENKGSTASSTSENPISPDKKEMIEKQKEEKSAENPYKNAKIETHTFQNKDRSWGYDISIDGSKSIVQPNIPGLPGNKGFNTADEAKKTGEFAAYKIHNNIMPPTLNRTELDSLGVLK